MGPGSPGSRSVREFFLQSLHEAQNEVERLVRKMLLVLVSSMLPTAISPDSCRKIVSRFAPHSKVDDLGFADGGNRACPALLIGSLCLFPALQGWLLS